MTARPKYKELYEAEVRRAKVLEDTIVKLNEQTTQHSDRALEADRQRYRSQNAHQNLFFKANAYRQLLNKVLTDNMITTNGWVQFPMMHPDDVTGLLMMMDDFNKYVENHPPSTKW
jgi:hypothetical protein